jgi:hypothetical protein
VQSSTSLPTVQTIDMVSDALCKIRVKRCMPEVMRIAKDAGVWRCEGVCHCHLPAPGHRRSAQGSDGCLTSPRLWAGFHSRGPGNQPFRPRD